MLEVTLHFPPMKESVFDLVDTWVERTGINYTKAEARRNEIQWGQRWRSKRLPDPWWVFTFNNETDALQFALAFSEYTRTN